MLEQHVAEVNRSLAAEQVMAGAQIRRFLILHKELDPDDGELTRTQKVRRGFVAERYAPLVTALYDGSVEADIVTEVTFEDGRRGTVAAQVEIRDIEIVPPAKVTTLGRPHERADGRAPRSCGAPVDRSRLAVIRRRRGVDGGILRHRGRRNSRHHRPERRRQDLDAQRHHGFYQPQQGRITFKGRTRTAMRPTRRRAAALPARSRMSPCSAACRRSTTSWPGARSA